MHVDTAQVGHQPDHQPALVKKSSRLMGGFALGSAPQRSISTQLHHEQLNLADILDDIAAERPRGARSG